MANVIDKKPDKGRKDLAESECKRFNELETQRRAIWDSMWQSLSQYFLPNMSDINTEKLETRMGWSERIYDTTGILDARTCTTGQANWATPSAEPWFQWAPPEALELDDDDEGARWLGNATDVALKILARSNYYRVSGTQYKNRTVFGTGHLHIEEGRDSLITCKARKIGTYCVAANADGIVDTVYSKFEITARQAEQEYGRENLGGKVLKALERKDGKGLDEKFWFLHVVRPRSELEREPGKIDGENKPIASIHIQYDDKFCCKVGGYDEMPDSVTRFDEWGTESVWGYSPAFECLALARQLNYIVRFEDAQAELRANPRLLIPTGLVGQVDLRPGGVTPYDPNVLAGAKPEEWMTQADLRTTQELTELKRDAMHKHFYTDVFRSLSAMMEQYKTPPTAFQIQQVLGERLEQLSPMFMRIITEKCDVDLRRIFGILFRAGKFGQPPPSLMVRSEVDGKVRLAMPEITYTSRLALALKALQNRATVDTMQFVTQYAATTGRVQVLDNFDEDAQIRRFAMNQGVSPRDLVPMKKVNEQRAARAQQAAQMQQLQMAEMATKSAANLGRAPEPMQQAAAEAVAPGA